MRVIFLNRPILPFLKLLQITAEWIADTRR